MRPRSPLARRRRSAGVLGRLLVPVCLALAVAVTVTILSPAEGSPAVPLPVAARSATFSQLLRSLTVPASSQHVPEGHAAMCRPEPPDYPGCTPRQVRPLIRHRFAAEYTGHAYGYRYYRMGQHPRGVIFKHLRPHLNAHLAAVYRRAVRRYAAEHTTVTVDAAGVPHRVVSYPRYRTWAGFRSHTTSFCTVNNVTWRFPVKYCAALTLLGRIGAAVNTVLRKTIDIVFACDGYSIGGVTSGGFLAWRMGTGVLRGGFYGGAGTEIACQTERLWSWAWDVW